MQFMHTSTCSFHFFFPGYIPAQKDIWIIGSKFLQDTYDDLHKLKEKAADNKSPMPYMYDFYNVIFHKENITSLNENVLLHYINAITHGLNNEKKLPRIILIIPDGDILQFINHFNFGISYILGSLLSWLINQIDTAIDCKKSEFRKEQPSIISSNEPKVISVKIHNHPKGQSQLLATRNKFNNILENLLHGHQ